MRAASLKILLVDNDGTIENEIYNALNKKAGIIADIDFFQPKDRNIRFGCKLPEGIEFEKYDLALVDLELFMPYNDPTNYKPEDLRGGTEVLPYIRQEAPWLPV